ncbi:MAG: 50S ribosome-binding GTPase [Candidatus Lokiarchaeota archaeon]|nr:50S ribosome-binding GTPase [Candidatus Lokiarchaeota archaeon]
MTQKPSLLIIGNSNVGKSSITRLLLSNPRKFKGKRGKSPGSTLLIRPITQPNMKFQVIDLPGFGYMSQSSHRRVEHVKKQIVIHIEKHHEDYFLCFIILNILRIEDEIQKYFIQNKQTIPLSFELIKFLNDFDIPLLIVMNKIDKVSNFDKTKITNLFLKSAEEFGLEIMHLDDFFKDKNTRIPFIEFSALKKENLEKLKKMVRHYL